MDTREPTLDWQRFAEGFRVIEQNVEKVVQGKQPEIRLALAALMAEGHILIEDVPGVGKTMLAKAIARSIDCSFRRIQFTPDLLPTDVTGVNVFNQERGDFEFKPGAIFANIVLGDEINRASPKTQSALLQAMQEHHVTVAGVRHDVPRPFHVLATQNPLEQEGTYPLPEAQLDRFLLQIDVSYPDAAAERRMLFATTGVEERSLKTILSAEELMMAQRLVRQLPVGDQVVDAILKLVRSARPGTGIDQELDDMIAWGPGPRASQALMLAVRAKAMIEGRLAPSVDDVIELAEPVLKHRMALTFVARAEGIDMSDMVARLIEPLG